MVDLSQLNEEQREAVTHGEGPLLVVSAAGSGKTRVLTYRAAWLTERARHSHGIMLCTFTKKAAEEMAGRVAGLLPISSLSEGMRIGTMHSILLRLLRVEGWPMPRFDILEGWKQKKMVRDILGPSHAKDAPRVIAEIGLAKNELLGIEDVPARLGDVWEAYEEEKRKAKSIDFDDMIVEAVKLLTARPEVLEKFRPTWLLVDEAQDTSTAQWRAMEMMTWGPDWQAVSSGYIPEPGPGTGNITAVADHRQAIYSWRGAKPEAILDFEQRFPRAVVLGLPRNYRSSSNIVATANRLIKHGGWEVEDMVADRGEGPSIRARSFPNSDDEAREAAHIVATEVSLGASPGQFAVLYRVNAYSRAYEEAMAGAGVPYEVVGSIGFFRRAEVADVLAYLQLAADPSDEDALRRIINRPTRYLGKVFCDNVAAESARSGRSLVDVLPSVPGIHERQRQSARRLQEHLREIAELEPSQAVRIVRMDAGVGYDAWLSGEELDAADEDRLENLSELESVAAKFDTLEDLLAYRERQTRTPESDDGGTGRVQLMSIHRAKGLEWDTVFAVGFADGVIPHQRASAGWQQEEERRLAYVALTRARDNLFVSWPNEWLGKAREPSPHLTESGLLEAVQA